jgi:hypothetical protein
MKPFVVGFAICIAGVIGVAAQTPMPKYGVTVTAEKGVDFAKFKAYSWTQGQPSPSKTIDAQVMAAVDRELAALGMTKAAQGPGDVLVAYYSLMRTDVDLKGKAGPDGLPQYPVGTLVVALLEPASRKRLLRLRTDKPIDTEPAKLEAAINSAAAALFAEYPTRKKK